MASQNESTQQVYHDSSGGADSGVIQLRLDTKEFLHKIESYLSGLEPKFRLNDEGRWVVEYEAAEEPPINKTGKFHLMNKLNMLFNSQTVQGNFTIEDFEEYIFFLHRNLSIDIAKNQIAWGVSDYNMTFIVNAIMDAARPFFSRLIDNEERKSYGMIKIAETHSTERSGFRLPFSGGS